MTAVFNVLVIVAALCSLCSVVNAQAEFEAWNYVSDYTWAVGGSATYSSVTLGFGSLPYLNGGTVGQYVISTADTGEVGAEGNCGSQNCANKGHLIGTCKFATGCSHKLGVRSYYVSTYSPTGSATITLTAKAGVTNTAPMSGSCNAQNTCFTTMLGNMYYNLTRIEIYAGSGSCTAAQGCSASNAIRVSAGPGAEWIRITPPANGTYLLGHTLDFIVTASGPVTCTSPTLSLTIGSVSKTATLISGTRTKVLTFRYTVVAGDEDLDGIALSATWSGTMTNFIGQAMNKPFAAAIMPNTAGILVAAKPPYVLGVSTLVSQPTWFTSSSTVSFYVVLSQTATSVTGCAANSVSVGTVIGSSAKNITLQAVREAGTITLPTPIANSGPMLEFSFSVTAGMLDADGILVRSPLYLASQSACSIQDVYGNGLTLSFSNDNITEVLIDTIAPTITSLTSSSSGYYGVGQQIYYNVTLSEAVFLYTPGSGLSVPLVLSSSTVAADYVSGNRTTKLVFAYTVREGDFAESGIGNPSALSVPAGAKVADVAGNALSVLSLPTAVGSPVVRVDGILPVLERVYFPANGLYGEGTVLQITVQSSKNLTVNNKPTFDFANVPVGSFIYASGSGTRNLTFTYTVRSTDNTALQDLNFKDVLTTNTSHWIFDRAKNAPASLNVSSLTLLAKPSIRIDGVKPIARQLMSPTAASRWYKLGDVVPLVLNWSEVVIPSSSTPATLPYLYVTLSTAGSTVNVAMNLSQWSVATQFLYFNYTVRATDEDTDGISVSNTLTMTGASFKDLAGNAAATPVTFSVSASVLLPFVLVDGRVPTISSSSWNPSTATKLLYGDTLTVTLTVSENCFVFPAADGFTLPAVWVNVTNRISYAVNASVAIPLTPSAGSNNSLSLSFLGTVPAFLLNVDSSGIFISRVVDLRGGSIVDKAGNPLTLVSLSAAPVITVDSVPPEIASIAVPPAGSYIAGNKLTFTLNVTRAVTVTGTPRIPLQVGSVTRYAAFVSSASSAVSLKFEYIVTSGDDTGLTTPAKVIVGLDFPSGSSIRDNARSASAGNGMLSPPVAANFSHFSEVYIDTVAPVIVNIVPPANGTYSEGSVIAFVVNMSEPVNVTGLYGGHPRTIRPFLTVSLDSGAGKVAYLADASSQGTYTSLLVFHYVVVANDSDATGIVLSSTLSLNGRVVRDQAANALVTLSFTAPSLAGVKVDAVKPTFNVSMSQTPPWTFILNEIIEIRVTASEVVSAVLSNVSSVMPAILINVSSSAASAHPSVVRRADLVPSSNRSTVLLFRYTLEKDLFDDDGISLLSFDTSGAIFMDLAGNVGDVTSIVWPSTALFTIDSRIPTVTSISTPRSTWFRFGETLQFVLNFSRSMAMNGSGMPPSIRLSIGAQAKQAECGLYASGVSLICSYSIAFGDLDLDGVDVLSPMQPGGFVLRDLSRPAAQNGGGHVWNISMFNTTALLLEDVNVDAMLLSVTNITVPPPGVYTVGSVLRFYLNLSKPIYFIRYGPPDPSLAITVGSAVRTAALSGGLYNSSSALAFEYVVAFGDNDLDGVSVSTSALTVPAAVLVMDRADQVLNTSLAGVAGHSSLLSVLVDTIAPLMSSVTVPESKWYLLNDTITLNVTFSKPVSVRGPTAARILVTIGSRNVSFIAQPDASFGSSVLFRYVVAPGDLDEDGLQFAQPAITMDSGVTIRDIAGNVLQILTFSAPSLAGVTVDAVLGFVTEIMWPVERWYQAGELVSLGIKLNKTVTVTGVPFINMTFGFTNRLLLYCSGNGSAMLMFSTNVTETDFDDDGVQFASSSIAIPSGSFIVDGRGNQIVYSLSFAGKGYSVHPRIKLDGVPPFVASIVGPPAGRYGIGAILLFTVSFSEKVSYVPYGARMPSLTLVHLTSSSTSTCAVLTPLANSTLSYSFACMVQPGDSAPSGVALVPSVDSGDVGLYDASGYMLNKSLHNVTVLSSPFTSVTVDGIRPFINGTYSAAPLTYLLGDGVSFNVSFSEPVYVVGSVAVNITIGDRWKLAPLHNGNQTALLEFVYHVEPGFCANLTTAQLVVPPNASIRDMFGNNWTTVRVNMSVSGIEIDSEAPVVVNTTVPLPGLYKCGTNITWMVNVNRPVRAPSVAALPYFSIVIGNFTRNVSLIASGVSTQLVFSYQITEEDLAPQGITISSGLLGLLEATNKATLPSLSGVLLGQGTLSNVVVDGVAPKVSNVVLMTNRTFGPGQPIDLELSFSEPVYVTLAVSGSLPAIRLNSSGVFFDAHLHRGNGTTSLVFRYVVQATDPTVSQLEFPNAVSSNGANFSDAIGNRVAVNGVQVSSLLPLASQASIQLDGQAPVVIRLVWPQSGLYKVNDTLNFTLELSSAVVVNTSQGKPKIFLSSASEAGPRVPATYMSGSNSTVLTFVMTVPNGFSEMSQTGIVLGADRLEEAGSRIHKSQGGNTVAQSIFATTVVANGPVRCDGILPFIEDISLGTNSSLVVGQNLSITVNFSEDVRILTQPTSATVRLEITLNNESVFAEPFEQPSSKVVTFVHTLSRRDARNAMIEVAVPMQQFQTSSVVDEAGNPSIMNVSRIVRKSVGVVPLVDPAVSNSDADNTKSSWDPFLYPLLGLVGAAIVSGLLYKKHQNDVKKAAAQRKSAYVKDVEAPNPQSNPVAGLPFHVFMQQLPKRKPLFVPPIGSSHPVSIVDKKALAANNGQPLKVLLADSIDCRNVVATLLNPDFQEVIGERRKSSEADSNLSGQQRQPSMEFCVEEVSEAILTRQYVMLNILSDADLTPMIRSSLLKDFAGNGRISNTCARYAIDSCEKAIAQLEAVKSDMEAEHTSKQTRNVRFSSDPLTTLRMSSALRALKQKQVAALESAEMASMFSLDTVDDQQDAAKSKRAMLFPEAHSGLSVGVNDPAVENFSLSEIDDTNFGDLEPEALADLILSDESPCQPELWLAQGPLDNASTLFREACHAVLWLAGAPSSDSCANDDAADPQSYCGAFIGAGANRATDVAKKVDPQVAYDGLCVIEHPTVYKNYQPNVVNDDALGMVSGQLEKGTAAGDKVRIVRKTWSRQQLLQEPTAASPRAAVDSSQHSPQD
jgi:hypothetical protein